MSTEELQNVTDWKQIVADSGEVVIGEIIGEGVPYNPRERRQYKRGRDKYNPFVAQFKHSALGLS